MNNNIKEAKIKQDLLFTEMAKILAVLSSPVRLKIIHFLIQAPHSVEQLANKLNQSLANTSMHLNKMQREELLICKTSAQKRIYQIHHPEFKDFWENILNFTLHQKSSLENEMIMAYQEDFSWKSKISSSRPSDSSKRSSNELKEVINLIQLKKAILVDVRPDDEIESSLLKHSLDPEDIIQLYYQELEKNLKNKTLNHLPLPKNKILFIICRGRLCVMSLEMTAQLRQKGFDAYRLNVSWHLLKKQLNKRRSK